MATPEAAAAIKSRERAKKKQEAGQFKTRVHSFLEEHPGLSYRDKAKLIVFLTSAHEMFVTRQAETFAIGEVGTGVQTAKEFKMINAWSVCKKMIE